MQDSWGIGHKAAGADGRMGGGGRFVCVTRTWFLLFWGPSMVSAQGIRDGVVACMAGLLALIGCLLLRSSGRQEGVGKRDRGSVFAGCEYVSVGQVGVATQWWC